MRDLKPGDTLPDNAPDWLFVLHYAPLIRQEPRLLAGLQRPDGSPYRERKHQFTNTKTNAAIGRNGTMEV